VNFTLDGDRPDMDINLIIEDREAIKAEIEDLTDRLDQLNGLIRTYYQDTYGEYEVGDRQVVIGRNHRFSETKARAVLDAETIEQITVQKLDSKKAREILTDAEWAECLNVGQPKVIVSERED
jgi:hypothetical protein